LTAVICLAEAPPTLSNTAFDNVAPNMVIKVPATVVSDYQTASIWSGYSSQISAID
jgi:hypothetical protein